jgi:hypothetical protein
VASWDDAFAIGNEFLIELFSRAEADKNDGDVYVRL